jgi:hypothetical protein
VIEPDHLIHKVSMENILSADLELLTGEGVESTISATRMFGLPGWAAVSSSGVEALDLPVNVRHVVIAADNDMNGVGQRAALSTRKRWAAEGRSVRILLPPNPGENFNDVLLSDAGAGSRRFRLHVDGRVAGRVDPRHQQFAARLLELKKRRSRPQRGSTLHR